MAEIVVYSRPGCHLCDQAKAIIARVITGTSHVLREADISQDPGLDARYKLDIPVVTVDGREAFRHFVNAAALEQLLAAAD